MLVKASCLLLLATTALARRHHERTTSNYAAPTAPVPIDYDDELTIQNPMVKPGNNLIFTFEQTRRDQPPLVDIREEDIGKYIGRRRKTTTTTTTTHAPTTKTSIPNSASGSEESSEEVNYEVPIAQQPIIVPQQLVLPKHQQWAAPSHPVMLATGTTAIPVFRGFHDFSEPIDLPDSSRIDPKTRFPDVDKWPRVALGTPPSPPKPEWDEFEDLQKKQPISTNFYQPQSTEHVPIQTSWTAPQTPQRKAHRGNRRHQKPANFTNVPTSTVTPTIAPYKAPVEPIFGARGPPPPVPTLTPWAGDNF